MPRKVFPTRLSFIAEDIAFAAKMIDDFQDEIERLQKQLPPEMQKCTIRFVECDRRHHGRLMATNWVQHECPQCKIERLEDRLRAVHGGCRMLSEGSDCDCGLCKRDREIERLEEEIGKRTP